MVRNLAMKIISQKGTWWKRNKKSKGCVCRNKGNSGMLYDIQVVCE